MAEQLTNEAAQKPLSRRSALKVGAGVGAAVWATPLVSVLSVTPASAQTTSGGTGTTPTCTGSAYDVKGVFVTTVGGQPFNTTTVGPAKSNSSAMEECLVEVQQFPTVPAVPGVPTINLTGSLGTDCVTGGCNANFTGSALVANIPFADIPISADVLVANATATCDPTDDDSQTSSEIVNLQVGDQTFDPIDNPGPFTFDTSDLPIGLPGTFTATVDIVREINTDTTASIDLIYITFRYTDALGTSVDGIITIGHAESAVANCP